MLVAQSYSAPAGIRPAQRRPGASILPGGRVIVPLGEQYITGAGPFGLVVSASGKTALTANGGPGRNSLTVLERAKSGRFEVRQIGARNPNAQNAPDAQDESGDAD